LPGVEEIWKRQQSESLAEELVVAEDGGDDAFAGL